MIEVEMGSSGCSAAIEYFVDDGEIGKMLGLHHRTIQQMARDGIIPGYPLGEGRRKVCAFSVRRFTSGCSEG